MSNKEENSSEEWSTGLFDCAQDRSNCCLTCWCPCITFGQIAEIVDEGCPPCGVSGIVYGLFSLTGIACCCYACMYRGRMRAKFNLPEEIAEVKHRTIQGPNGQWNSQSSYECNSDCMIHCCCHRCALCQEYRELKYRGYDPALGWKKNLERQQREMGTAMEPPVNPTMAR
ncbi:hypothetical protein SUGI_1054920 [Cryptomeria japonica]|nr:hypothetical protein SUGI_1054920 [Cryptomeria japonica]